MKTIQNLYKVGYLIYFNFKGSSRFEFDEINRSQRCEASILSEDR